MNLIRNTLLTVAFLQLLGFLYIKLIDEKRQNVLAINTETASPTMDSQKMDKMTTIALANTLPIENKPLPTSTEYTDNLKQKVVEKAEAPLLVAEKKITKPKLTPTLKLASTETKNKKTSKPIHLTFKNKKSKVSNYTKIASYSKKFLGHKYVWGSTGPNTFDCSGFTQNMFRNTAGIRLPRVSREQAKIGKYVEYNELKLGDMVFFDTNKKRTGKVNHVGIYLGNNNFIHASSGKKKVVITNFQKKKFYKNRFLLGRRVLKDTNQNLATLVQTEISKL